MANNRINRYIGAIVLGTVLTAVPGCTDTWDDHYDGDGSVTETTATLWDRIKDNPEYSRFADIVRNAKYYKDNTHPVANYSYEDILGGGQVNTVWVPDNSVLSEAEYQKWMSMLTSGDMTDGYNVQQQFLGNHIALWRHNISEPGVDTVKMINGKNLSFDKGLRTLDGIPLGEYNIPSVNGVMHILKGVAPFRYNLYEHLKYGNPQAKISQYVVGKDTIYFSADYSIEGLPDENGNPTYVDSVYLTSNKLFETTSYVLDDQWIMAEEGFGEHIDREDSAFVMIVPTDAAWDAAYAKLEPAYKYATKYEDKTLGDGGATGSSIALKLDDKVDSLTKMSIKMDLVSPLVFNVRKQPKNPGEPLWSLDKFIDEKELLDSEDKYMLNTFRDTLRAVGDWKPSDLFSGVEPVRMSNGLAYEVNSWNFPSKFYTPDVEVEIEGQEVFYNVTAKKNTIFGYASRKLSFSNEKFKKVTDIYGQVSNNNFYYLAPQSSSKGPIVEIKLQGNSPTAYVPNAQVMSGKYDIKVVFVPYWYRIIALTGGMDYFYKTEIVQVVDPEDENNVRYETRTTEELDEDYILRYASASKYLFKAYITYNQASGTEKSKQTLTSKALTYNGLTVDTITVAENFEFPVSYKNLRKSYPTLILENTKKKEDGYVFDLIIDKVILERKD